LHKMVLHITKVVIFVFVLNNFVDAKNQCFKEGITWNNKGQLEFIPQVDFQECTRAFVQNSDAKGFTWFEDFNGYKDICIIFGELNGKQSCKNCSSFKQNGNCVYDQQQGECEITEDNFISASYAESEVECYIQCLAVDGCDYYTWLSKGNDINYDQCLLFSSCDTVNLCVNLECFVGSVTLPDLCSDDEYFILNDETRNMDYGYQNAYCDDNMYNTLCQSPDWNGSSWYKFDEPAGTQMPEYIVDYYHCNAYAPGWLNGTHPTILGETVDRNVCFNYNGDNSFCKPVQIKNCGAYFLYHLENIRSYVYRYCAE